MAMTNTKTLTPPEVVQALLDGRVLSYTRLGTVIHIKYRDGSLLHRIPSVTAEWTDGSIFNMASLLNGHTTNWSVSHERYDFQEAVRRMKDGGKVRRDAWPLAMSVMLLPGDHSPGLIIIIGTINHDKYYLAAIEDIEATDWEDA